MGFSTHRVLILLICIGLLSVQPDKVSGLRSIDTALREHKQDNHILLQIRRFLKVVNMEGMSTEKRTSASRNDKVDPNQSSKRQVRRGSDPIHNRC
ncbi:hypothetical protein TIFTF001_011080 [Ficus carica]|uniref:CLAVATA3/ESR (CLE)-related protein 45 n=1 Tax=Ficus carica TaxID=3494 RepID=A0AA87ZWJ1_FICCA|nr:hypothetical protein TIFTF001_011080 [Ficus carica]